MFEAGYLSNVDDEALIASPKYRARLVRALADAAAPWLTVVDAIRAVLPDPAPRDLQRALALARAGISREDAYRIVQRNAMATSNRKSTEPITAPIIPAE